MPWTGMTFNKKHLGGTASKSAAHAGATAATSALNACLKKGKSRAYCEGYAVRVGKSVANKTAD